MDFRRFTGRSALAATAIAGVLAAAPAAQAAAPGTAGDTGALAAPVGRQCGAYRDMGGDHGHLWYWHCGDGAITVEVDKIKGSNQFVCVGPREDVFLDYVIFSDNAWYARPGC